MSVTTNAVNSSPVPWLDNSTEKTATKTTSNSSLGKDEFMKILLAQLKYQDPLEPMDDKEFISQMASFSALEQMTNLNTGFTDLSTTINDTLLPNLVLQQSINLIGKEVSYTSKTTNTDGTEGTETLTGTIQSVILKQGVPYYIIDDKEVAIANVTQINQNGLGINDQLLLEILNTLDEMKSALSPEEGEVDGE